MKKIENTKNGKFLCTKRVSTDITKLCIGNIFFFISLSISFADCQSGKTQSHCNEALTSIEPSITSLCVRFVKMNQHIFMKMETSS